MPMLRWTALALAGIAAAVLVTPAVAQEVEIKPAAKVKRDKYVLTAEEIAERPEITNAYDAVKLLRPNFLKTTRAKASYGSGSSGGSGGAPDPYKPGGGTSGGSYGSSSAFLTAVLYTDEIKQPDLDQLRSVVVGEIVEIRYLAGTEAASRYGSGHEGGAILLKTRKFAKP